MLADLMKAMKLVQKAQENKIDLSISNESLLLEKLSKIEKKQQTPAEEGGPRPGGCFYLFRWSIYISLWIIGIAYLVALNHRESLCLKLV